MIPTCQITLTRAIIQGRGPTCLRIMECGPICLRIMVWDQHLLYQISQSLRLQWLHPIDQTLHLQCLINNLWAVPEDARVQRRAVQSVRRRVVAVIRFIPALKNLMLFVLLKASSFWGLCPFNPQSCIPPRTPLAVCGETAVYAVREPHAPKWPPYVLLSHTPSTNQ